MRICKISLTLCICLFFCFGAMGNGEEKKACGKCQAVSLNLGTAAIGFFEASYYRKLNRKTNFVASLSWYDYRAALLRVYSKAYAPFASVGAQVHFTGSAMQGGLYIEPSVKLGYIVHPEDKKTVDNPSGNPDGNLVSRMASTLGYNRVFKSGLMIDLNAGAELYYAFGKFSEKEFVYGSAFFRPVVKAAIGYAW